MSFLGWIYLVCRFRGYFHVGGEVEYSDFEGLIKQLEAWPQNQPFPVVLYRKFVDVKPPLRRGLVKAKRGGNGWGVFPVFVESDLTFDLLGEGRVFAWAPNSYHLKILEEAFTLSDRLTRWLRGGVGWKAGPRPDVCIHDFLTGFKPRWRR